MIELYMEYWSETAQLGKIDPAYVGAEANLHIQPRRMKYLNSKECFGVVFG